MNGFIQPMVVIDQVKSQVREGQPSQSLNLLSRDMLITRTLVDYHRHIYRLWWGEGKIGPNQSRGKQNQLINLCRSLAGEERTHQAPKG